MVNYTVQKEHILFFHQKNAKVKNLMDIIIYIDHLDCYEVHIWLRLATSMKILYSLFFVSFFILLLQCTRCVLFAQCLPQRRGGNKHFPLKIFSHPYVTCPSSKHTGWTRNIDGSVISLYEDGFFSWIGTHCVSQ